MFVSVFLSAELAAGCFGADYNLVIVMTMGVQQTAGSGMLWL